MIYLVFGIRSEIFLYNLGQTQACDAGIRQLFTRYFLHEQPSGFENQTHSCMTSSARNNGLARRERRHPTIKYGVHFSRGSYLVNEVQNKVVVVACSRPKLRYEGFPTKVGLSKVESSSSILRVPCDLFKIQILGPTVQPFHCHDQQCTNHTIQTLQILTMGFPQGKH